MIRKSIIFFLFSVTCFSVVGQNTIGYVPFRSGNKWTFSDKNGKIIIDQKFDSLDFKPGQLYIFVQKDLKWGVIDTNMNQILECVYEEIVTVSEDFWVVKTDGNYKIINLKYPNYPRKNYKLITPVYLKTIRNYYPYKKYEYFFAKDSLDNVGIINKWGQVLVPFTPRLLFLRNEYSYSSFILAYDTIAFRIEVYFINETIDNKHPYLIESLYSYTLRDTSNIELPDLKRFFNNEYYYHYNFKGICQSKFIGDSFFVLYTVDGAAHFIGYGNETGYGVRGTYPKRIKSFKLEEGTWLADEHTYEKFLFLMGNKFGTYYINRFGKQISKVNEYDYGYAITPSLFAMTRGDKVIILDSVGETKREFSNSNGKIHLLKIGKIAMACEGNNCSYLSRPQDGSEIFWDMNNRVIDFDSQLKWVITVDKFENYGIESKNSKYSIKHEPGELKKVNDTLFMRYVSHEWRYIHEGKILSKEKYLISSNNGYRIYSGKNYKKAIHGITEPVYYLNSNCIMLIKNKKYDIFNYSLDKVIFKNGDYFLTDTNRYGEYDPIYIFEFNHGALSVHKDGKWHLIDSAGNRIFNGNTEFPITYYSDNFSSCSNRGFLQGIVSVKHQLKTETIYKSISYSAVKNSSELTFPLVVTDSAGTKFYMDEFLQTKPFPIQQFDELDMLQNGFIKITTNGKSGIIDSLGNWVIPQIYEIMRCYDDHVTVRLDNNWGVVSYANEIIHPIKYKGCGERKGWYNFSDENQFHTIFVNDKEIVSRINDPLPLTFDIWSVQKDGIVFNINMKTGFIYKD